MMTKRRLKIGLPALLIFSIVSVSAVAGLVTLPESAANYSGTGWYQGVALQYRVYDTNLQADQNKIDAPGVGRYIYAYQAFNVANNSPIAYLSLHGIEENAIKETSDVASVEADGGVEPINRHFNNDKTVVTYEFTNGSLTVNKNSWFLTIRSDGKPKTGTFTLAPPSDSDILVPGSGDPVVPEPMTFSLLLLGAGAVLKKRKSRQASSS